MLSLVGFGRCPRKRESRVNFSCTVPPGPHPPGRAIVDTAAALGPPHLGSESLHGNSGLDLEYRCNVYFVPTRGMPTLSSTDKNRLLTLPRTRCLVVGGSFVYGLCYGLDRWRASLLEFLQSRLPVPVLKGSYRGSQRDVPRPRARGHGSGGAEPCPRCSPSTSWRSPRAFPSLTISRKPNAIGTTEMPENFLRRRLAGERGHCRFHSSLSRRGFQHPVRDGKYSRCGSLI